MCRHIQAYSPLLKHIQAYWGGIIKAFLNLACSQPCHIQSSGIFRTRGIFKILWNLDQAYSEPCHSQNSSFRHFIQPYSGIFKTLCNAACICRNLAYSESRNNSEPFHNFIPTPIQNPFISTKIGKFCVTVEIQNPGIITILKYSGTWHI